MESIIITTMLLGIGSLIGSIALATLAGLKGLRETREALAEQLGQATAVQNQIHQAVNSNYQEMLQRNMEQERELRAQTQHILELNKVISTLIERLDAPSR